MYDTFRSSLVYNKLPCRFCALSYLCPLSINVPFSSDLPNKLEQTLNHQGSFVTFKSSGEMFLLQVLSVATVGDRLKSQ